LKPTKGQPALESRSSGVYAVILGANRTGLLSLVLPALIAALIVVLHLVV
jgi:hypothetical protein